MLTNSKKLYTYLALTITIILWASAFVGIRAGLHGYSPGALALFRYGVASICMLFLFFRLPTHHHVSKKDGIKLFILGVVGFAVYNVTLNYGEVTVTSSIASFIVGLIPVFMTILAVIFLKERLKIFAWIGVLVSLSGIIVIAIGEHAGVAFDYGVLFCIVTTLSGAIYSVSQKPLLKRFSAIEINAYAIWAGTIAMLYYLPQLIREIPHAPWTATFSAIYMGIFPAAIAYVAWSYVLKQIPASRAASFLYLLPLMTTLQGWLILGEKPEIISFVGGLIAILGAILVNIFKFD